MRTNALVHEPETYRPCDPQSAEALRLLWCQGRKTVQIKLPNRLPIAVTRNRRFYIFGLRCHHGLTGVVVVTVGTVLRKFKLVLLGALLCLHDKEDYPWLITQK